jgi:hypothetical protein
MRSSGLQLPKKIYIYINNEYMLDELDSIACLEEFHAFEVLILCCNACMCLAGMNCDSFNKRSGLDTLSCYGVRDLVELWFCNNFDHLEKTRNF